MPGVPLKSGPPGNQNAIGNAGGAPAGNRNGVRHGLHSFQRRGVLPPGHEDVAESLAQLQGDLEAAIADLHDGEVSVTRAAQIDAARRHEAGAQLLAKWLAENPQLPIERRVELIREISRLTDRRNSCIAALALDSTPEQSSKDRFAFLTSAATPTDSHVPADQNAVTRPQGRVQLLS